MALVQSGSTFKLGGGVFGGSSGSGGGGDPPKRPNRFENNVPLSGRQAERARLLDAIRDAGRRLGSRQRVQERLGASVKLGKSDKGTMTFNVVNTNGEFWRLVRDIMVAGKSLRDIWPANVKKPSTSLDLFTNATVEYEIDESLVDQGMFKRHGTTINLAGGEHYIVAVLLSLANGAVVLPVEVSCEQCASNMAPFLACIIFVDLAGNIILDACTNCIYPNHRTRCSFYRRRLEPGFLTWLTHINLAPFQAAAAAGAAASSRAPRRVTAGPSALAGPSAGPSAGRSRSDSESSVMSVQGLVHSLSSHSITDKDRNAPSAQGILNHQGLSVRNAVEFMVPSRLQAGESRGQVIIDFHYGGQGRLNFRDGVEAAVRAMADRWDELSKDGKKPFKGE